ncbi:Uma2 family endonuclease [Pseudonocardia sichuanensis]
MPLHRDLMTLEEFVALPEGDSARYELQEGVLVMAPRPRPLHQDAMFRLGTQIDRCLPPELTMLLDVDVVVQAADPATVRSPDVVVTTASTDVDRLTASDVLLAVEIISPGSRNVDLHLKPFEYADAGIPHYWVVDLDPPAPTITVHGLSAPGDGYAESRTAAGELVVQEPFAMRIDIAALVARRGGASRSEG